MVEAKTGTVIILNGPSAAGKTTLQKKIQEVFDAPYVCLGIDQLFDNILPDYYGLGEVHPKGKFDTNDIRSITNETDESGHKTITLHIGPIGEKVIQGMHDAIAAYAKAGNNVVVDYIQYEPHWRENLLKALEGIKTYFVKVDISLEELEKREKSRGTSPAGHARSHYHHVHQGMVYDIEVNSEKDTPEAMALTIKNLVEGNNT